MVKKIHPAWTALVVTFLTLMATAGFRSAPSVLIVPLEDAFGWSRAQVSTAIAINVLIYGLIAPFAAALMERFTVRKVVMAALTFVAISAGSTVFISQAWHLWLLWGVCVGVGTGSMALVFAATVANRWFIKNKGIVVGALTAASATGQLIFLPLLSHFAVTYGWKSVSITIAIASFAVVPLIYFFLKESPAAVGTTPYGAPDDWQPLEKSDLSAYRLAVDTISKAKSNRDFRILFFTFFVCGLSTNGLIGTHFIPAAHDHGMPATTAAGLLAVVGIFDFVGTILSGYLTDKVDSVILLVFYYGLRGLALLTVPFVLGPSVELPLLFFVVFYGLDWIATVPPTVELCRKHFGLQKSPMIYGWVFASHMVGAAIAAWFAGSIRHMQGSYFIAWITAAALCLVAAMTVLGLKKLKPVV